MYDAKQLRLWLMVIPFWIMHFLGASSLLSQNDFINSFRESNVNESYLSYEVEALVYSEFVSLVNNGFNKEIERLVDSRLAIDAGEDMKQLGTINNVSFDSLMLCERQDETENKFTSDMLDSEYWYDEDDQNNYFDHNHYILT